MSNRFVRSSKFRHVFGTPNKREQCYDNIRVTKSPNESNMCCVNSKYIAVVLEQQGGGAFQVMDLNNFRRFDSNYPKVSGHKYAVLDIVWNPFDDDEIASASEDCTIMIWKVTPEYLKTDIYAASASMTLEGHQKKVQYVAWHPSAANIIMSSGCDPNVIIWNTLTGEQVMNCSVFPDLINSVSWNYNGSLIVVACKDKKLRVINPRNGDVVWEINGHSGTKPSRAIFCGTTNKIFTTGFTKMSDRQYALWDMKMSSGPVIIEKIDTGTGVLFPFWDESTKMVFIVGKGDTQIKYFEINDQSPFIHFLNLYQSTQPQRGCGLMPKRDLEVKKCEMQRFYKVHNKGLVEPISMCVPRKSEMFQDDLFPPCPAGKPALQAAEWISGKDKDPWLVRFSKDGRCDMTLEESQIFSSKQDKVVAQRTSSVSSNEKLMEENTKLKEENVKLKKRIQELEDELAA